MGDSWVIPSVTPLTERSVQVSLKSGKFEDEHAWRLRGQRRHQILEAKVYNLKVNFSVK